MQGKLVNHPPSIADVARESGVSKATVSNWLNGRHDRVSPPTRERLAAVAEQLGYRPMLGARRLSSRARSGTVGLLVRRDLAGVFSDPYMERVMEGVGRAFAVSATRGLVVTSPPGPGEDTEYLLSLSRGIVDGFLVFDIGDHDRTLEAFVRHDVPFVAVGQPLGPTAFPWVASSHAGAVTEAVHWLVAQGHSWIALETGAETLLVNQHRRRGYLAALFSHGLEPDPGRPTAVLLARGTPFSSPSDPQIVHLDGPSSDPSSPWIETPSDLVGHRAALLLDRRIAGQRPGPELHLAVFHPGTTAPSPVLGEPDDSL